MIPVRIDRDAGQFARVQPRLRAVVRDFAVYLSLLLLFVVPASLLPASPMLEVLGFSSLIAIVLYEPLTVAFGGGTIGHRTLNMRVVRAGTLGRVGLPRAVLRSFIKLIFGLVSFSTIYFTVRHQALHDLAAGTVVVPRRAGYAPAGWFGPARVPDEYRRLPSPMRRLAVMLGYGVAWFILIELNLSWLLSSRCVELNRCQGAERFIVLGLNLVFLAGIVTLGALGWTGRLWGARALAEPPEMASVTTT